MRNHGSRLSAALTAVVILLCASQCAHNKENLEAEKLYTTHNIWIHAHRNMKCINYKCGKASLPAGTEVRDVESRRRGAERQERKEIEREGSSQLRVLIIVFTPVNTGRAFTIQFNPKWHPGKTISDYMENMFSTRDFEELTEGMTETEVNAIKSGEIVEGMSKRAVLCCYGPPPEHVTPSLDWPVWVYWMNKFKRKKVCFDENNLTTECE
jgi:hypothetical protein